MSFYFAKINEIAVAVTDNIIKNARKAAITLIAILPAVAFFFFELTSIFSDSSAITDIMVAQ